MNLFKSKLEGIEAIRQKLRDAEQEITSLEAEFDEASIEAAASGAYGPSELIASQLKAAHLKIEVLHRAEIAEQRAEAARLAEARQKEARARQRALRSHLANLQREAANVEAAVAQMVRSWNALRATAGQAQALLNPTGQPFAELGEGKLRRLCELEIARIGSVATTTGDRPDAPGAEQGHRWLVGRVPQHLPALSSELERICAFVLGETPKLDTPATPAVRSALTPGTEEWAEAKAREAMANG